ncbi:MAG: hypothetical protein WC178_05060 [Candidatus Paceibacterota bacterium]
MIKNSMGDDIQNDHKEQENSSGAFVTQDVINPKPDDKTDAYVGNPSERYNIIDDDNSENSSKNSSGEGAGVDTNVNGKIEEESIEEYENKDRVLTQTIAQDPKEERKLDKEGEDSAPIFVSPVVEGLAMAALQKNLGAGKKSGFVNNLKRGNLLFIIVLIALLIIFSTILLKRKSNEDYLPSVDVSDESENKKVDPFADIDNQNDATRMRNITVLANIAAVYHLEEKADLPISIEYVKLNEDNPVSEFMKDALNRYGKETEIMLDPAGGSSYFAYRSEDGLSIEISAMLEDIDSYDCVEDPCIFKKVLTDEDLRIMSLDLEQYK